MSQWVKSSFSNGNGGNNCVEVRTAEVANTVFVRHSRHHRPMLQFSREEWSAFLAGVKAGEFDGDGGV